MTQTFMKIVLPIACPLILISFAAWSVLSQGSDPTPAAAGYTIAALPVPPDFDYFEPRKINENGEIAGRLDASFGPYKDDSHAGFHSAGLTVDLHPLVAEDGSLTSGVIDLNDRGELLLRSDHGFFLMKGGEIASLEDWAVHGTLQPAAMNNRGQIVGVAEMGERMMRGFSYQNGHLRLIGDAHFFGAATALNDRGLIAGAASETGDWDDFRPAFFCGNHTQLLSLPHGYVVAVNNHGDAVIATPHATTPGFLWNRKGEAIELPFTPRGINDKGQIVGLDESEWPPRAFLYSGGVSRELQEFVPAAAGIEWELLSASDINDAGQVVGLGRRAGVWTGFVMNRAKEEEVR